MKIGQSNIEATQDLIDGNLDYAEDEDDGPLFWFALADTQWKYGRLLPEVKEEAIRQIKLGTDLARWSENKKQYKKRKQVLEELESRLNSSQPSEKKVPKLHLQKAVWKPGDVLLYKIHTENSEITDDAILNQWNNKYVLLRVLEIMKTNKGSLPREYSDEHHIVAVYNWVGDIEPDPSIIKKLSFIIEKKNSGEEKDVMYTFSFNRRELKLLDFKVIMEEENYKADSSKTRGGIGIPWPHEYQVDYAMLKALNIAKNNGTLIDDSLK